MNSGTGAPLYQSNDEWQLPHPDTLLSLLYILLIALALLGIVWMSFIIMGKCSEMAAKIAEVACRASGVVFIVAIALLSAASIYGYKSLSPGGIHGPPSLFSAALTSLYASLPLSTNVDPQKGAQPKIQEQAPAPDLGQIQAQVQVQTQPQAQPQPQGSDYAEMAMAYATKPVAPITAALKDCLYIAWNLFVNEETTGDHG